MEINRDNFCYYNGESLWYGDSYSEFLLIYVKHNFPLKIDTTEFFYADDISFIESIKL